MKAVCPDTAIFGYLTARPSRDLRKRRLSSTAFTPPMAERLAGRTPPRRAVNGYAYAHDLRRSCGTRRSKPVMPAILPRPMGHADISTTMGFCVDLDADEGADGLWASMGQRPVPPRR